MAFSSGQGGAAEGPRPLDKDTPVGQSVFHGGCSVTPGAPRQWTYLEIERDPGGTRVAAARPPGETTRETAASVRADCVLAGPGHFAMAKMARAISRSLRRGFELTIFASLDVGRGGAPPGRTGAALTGSRSTLCVL